MEIDAILLKLDPNNVGFQLVAADEEMFYAQALPQARNAEQLRHYQHVLEIDKKINQNSPSPSRAEAVAAVCNRIAMWYDGQRDHVKSAEYHRQYLEIIEGLYAADSQNIALKQEVVIGSANLGEEIGFLGHKSESERLLDRAVTLMRPIAQASPQNTSDQGFLAAAFTMRGDNYMHWKNFKSGLDDYGSAIGVYRQLVVSNPKNTTAEIRLNICRLSIAHAKLAMGDLRAAEELRSALVDIEPFLSGDKANDEALYAAAAGYADAGEIEFTAARDSRAAAKRSHLESAAHWYGLSLSTLKRVQNLASQSESEAFGPLDPARISKQIALCQSALGRARR
jgi:tetratricopeptide (TPR) repeat protein